MSLLPVNYSLFSSIALVVLTMAGMQMFKEQIAMEGNLLRLSIGGFAGSWIFVFALTAIGNTYSLLFPQNSHVRLFPETLVALIIAVIGSAMVHRVCATTCIIFSLTALYYINKLSNSTYSQSQYGSGPSSTKQGRQGSRYQNGAPQASPKSRR